MMMKDDEYAALGLQAPPARVDPPAGPRDVASLIERAAARCPDDEALVDATRRYSFGQLATAVRGVAALFATAGIRAGDRIAASLGNESNLVVGFFAAMRLGAVWVGINKILPAGDKQFILAHSGARLLLTDTSLADQIEGLREQTPELASVLILDDPARDGGWNAALGNTSADAPHPETDPFAPAAIMYTSGTTGVPKGVVHSQHNMVVVAAATSAHNLLGPESRRGVVLPLTVTNLMILGPVTAFWNCQPMVIGPVSKIGPIVEWLHQEKVEHVSLVPTLVYDLLQSNLEVPEFTHLGSGGAPLPHVVREAFRERYGYELMTSYGLTEAPTVVAISAGEAAPEGASGKALPHFELSIRDADGKPLPVGEVGEVCFTAVQSGPWAGVYTPPLGYWRDAEKTAALLRGGVVHTGDHGRIDADGWLSIADRSSELILRGGSNVYPAEIERILHMHDDVADCAIIGKPDLRMGMLTVACIQPARPDVDKTALQEELRALCLERLVRYKVPDVWYFLDSFPRNAMGKIVKPRLREQVLETP